jgi:hypothetical protein
MKDFFGKKALLAVIDTVGDISQHFNPNPPIQRYTYPQPTDAEKVEIERLMKKHGVYVAIQEDGHIPYFFRDAQNIKFQ